MKKLLSILGIIGIVATMVMSVASPVSADGSKTKAKAQSIEVVGQEKQVNKTTKVRLDKVNYDKKTGLAVSKEYTAEITGIPSVTDSGKKIDPQWHKKQDASGQVYYVSGENTFIAKVTENGRVSVQDTTTGRLNTWEPTITVGMLQFNILPNPIIIDETLTPNYRNPNYRNNVLQFTYEAKTAGGLLTSGTTIQLKRYVRLIEGVLNESYSFESNPKAQIAVGFHPQNDPKATAELSTAVAFDSTPKTKFLKVENYNAGFVIDAAEFEGKTYPVIVDPTSSFTTSSYDGFLQYDSTVSWATAHDAVTASSTYSSSSANYIMIGATQPFAAHYFVYRAGVFFDTSALQDDITITSGYLSLYNIAKYDAVGAYSVVIQSGAPTYPHAPMVMGDYNASYYSGTGGSISSGTIGSGYNNIVLNSTGLAWVNKTGTSRFMLRNSYDINNTAPPYDSVSWGTQWQVASYEYGTGYAPKLSITYSMPVVTPTVTTIGSSDVGETSATLQGLLTNDGNESNIVSFEYGTTPSYGFTSSTSSGYTTDQYFNIGITGLTRGTTYYYRAKATNSAGTGYGAAMTLTTLPAAPYNFAATAGNSTVALSWTKGTGATNTMIRFSTTSYPTSISDGTQVYNSTGASTNHTSLTPGTTYFYSAWSSAGSGYSTTYTMAYAVPYTIGAPNLTTRDATAVGVATATLNGYLDALNQIGGDVTVSFQYGENTTYASNAAAGTSAAPASFYANIAGLSANTTYHFRAKGVGTEGTGYGLDKTFTTGAISAPTVDTTAATALGLTFATLNGIISEDGGASCTVYFKWGLTSIALINTTESASGIYETVPFYYSITGLTANTTYYYQAVGQNSGGTAYGDIVSFTSSAPTSPTVVTNTALNVGATSGVLSGTLSSDGGVPSEVQFEWDDDATGAPYANSTGWQSGKITGNTFLATLTGLTPATTIYFRASAKNSTNTTYGSEKTFDTVFTAPTNFMAKSLGASTIGLNWGKTGDQTYIVAKTTGYPVDRLDGTQVYFGASNSYTHSALIAGLTYFYEAWSWQEGDTWSGTSVEDAATTAAVLSSAEQETPEYVTVTEPSGLYQEPSSSRLHKIPGYAMINDFAVNDLQMPSGYFWMIVSMIISIAIGALIALAAKGDSTAVLLGLGFSMGGFILLGTLPLWWLVFVALLVLFIPVLRGRSQGGD